MSLVHRRTKAEIEADRQREEQKRRDEAEAKYQNPFARELYLKGEINRANSVEQRFLADVETERIRTEGIAKRGAERVQHEAERLRNASATLEAERQAQKDAIDKAQAAQAERLAAEKDAIARNQERVRQAAQDHLAELERLKPKDDVNTAPKGIPQATCRECGASSASTHAFWCKGGY